MNQQHLDLLELGYEPARCLKGENDPRSSPKWRERLVAGRAYRAVSPQLRRERNEKMAHIWGRKPNLFYEQLLDRLEQQKEFERRRVAVRDKKVAALERDRARLKSTLKLIDKATKDALQ